MKLINLEFLVAIVKGQKNLINERESCVITMQRYKEFNGKTALEFCEGDVNLCKFVPQDWFKTNELIVNTSGI